MGTLLNCQEGIIPKAWMNSNRKKNNCVKEHNESDSYSGTFRLNRTVVFYVVYSSFYRVATSSYSQVILLTSRKRNLYYLYYGISWQSYLKQLQSQCHY